MKKLVTTEDIELLKKLFNDSSKNPSLEPLTIGPLLAVAVGMIIVWKKGEETYIEIPDDVQHKYISDWQKDVGKVLSKTLKKKQYDLLYEFKSDVVKAILRKILPSEMDDAKANGFVHINYGDNYYTIIKIVPADGNYRKKDMDYSEIELPKMDDEDEELFDEDCTDPEAEVSDVDFQCVPLFDDADI